MANRNPNRFTLSNRTIISVVTALVAAAGGIYLFSGNVITVGDNNSYEKIEQNAGTIVNEPSGIVNIHDSVNIDTTPVK